MPALTPNQAVKIANYVYETRTLSLNIAAEVTPHLGIDGLFDLNDASRFHGTSGPTIINKRSGFGYIAKGINHHKDEVLIALRGTQFTHLYDVWTDANIGVQKGPGGWPVHAGFNDTFNSIKAELLNFFVKNNPSHVHCISHSLGGAPWRLWWRIISANSASVRSRFTPSAVLGSATPGSPKTSPEKSPPTIFTRSITTPIW